MSLGLVIAIGPALGGEFIADTAVAALGFVVSAATGGLIIFRRQGHLTGWLLVLVGLAIVFANNFWLLTGVTDELAAWVGSWSWTLVFALYAVLTLTFPSGDLPEGHSLTARFGRIAVWALPVFVAMAPFTDTLGGPEIAAPTANPVGLIPGRLSWVPLLGTFGILLGAVISLLARHRRAAGVERAQLSWVVFSLLVLVMSIAGTFAFILVSIAIGAGDPGDEAWTVAFIGMTLFPIAFAVAILRYKLFEIDRIVSRTVSYAVLIGSLAVVFGAIAIGIPRILRLPDDSQLIVSGATLAAAALFNPLRRRTQAVVDRRFNRTRYNAQHEVGRFTDRLRTRVALDELSAEMLAVVARTMQPDAASLWIREKA